MSTVIDVFKTHVNTKKKDIIFRGFICLVYFLLGLTMATQVFKSLIEYLSFFNNKNFNTLGWSLCA